MSHPGVRSSRGDAYQTCIALQWVIQLIEDSSISWIEVDSTRAISTGVHIPVDDVVVGYVDGRETCCQCKKNQPKFNVWTIDELAGELVKAATHLVAEPGAEVRFYARADFGSLLQIRERARLMSDATSFAAGMPAEQAKEVAKLHAKWAEALGHEQFTVYDLIKRIQFVLTKDVDDLLEELSRLLATKVTQGQAAFNELWTRLVLLGARVQANGSNSAAANSHRITRDEVLRLLKEHGCFVAPPMAEIDIAGKLAAMSAIGRAWRRDVAGRRMDRAAVDALETAAQQSAKVLLTDGPGAGKTCVLLNLAERLEARPGIASLFIQAREFADATTAAEREALGLAPDLVALVSAMSQFRRVAVVMDSLDVLSLARNNLNLIFFLGLIDQLSRIPNVCVIAACRSFDLQYDKRLAARHWDQTVVIGGLDWDVDVVPTLQALAIPPDDIEDTTRELITGPNTVFIDATSFGADRQRTLARYGSALTILMEGFEKAVLIRAKSSASWWNVNGRRICLNDCGGLRHIGNVVMTQFPEANLNHLRDYFANETLLVATSPPQLRILIRAAATLIEAPTLDQIERHVLHRHHDKLPGGALWLDIDRYELLSAVPAGLRSEVASRAFDDYSQKLPLPSWHPASTAMGDSDYSNFKGAVLIGLSDGALVELMGREPTFPSFLGGLESFKERLRSIASSCPRRFLTLLAARWSEISDASREAILEGATGYMRCRYGDLSDARWEPIEEVPAVELANLLLDELDRHPFFWRHDKVACKAILACSGQIQDPRLVERLLFLASGFAASPDPACDERYGDDMLTTAINCSRGLLARALVDMANGLIEAGILDLPPLLKSTLLRLANDCHPAVRVEIMRNLTFMQSRLHLGWELFDRAFTDADERVWAHADRPFYYGYAKEFDRVRPYLVRMQTSSRDAVLEIWGRISALASLAGHVSQAGLEAGLVEMNSKPAWDGATRVWAANMRHMEFRNTCEQGMGLAMQHVSGRGAALMHFSEAFEITESVAKIPLGLMRSAFSNVNGSDINHQMNGVDDWLCAIADVDLDHALAAAEIAAAACKELGQSPFYDEEVVGTLLTALFREAEEREESDSGEMIKRVVLLQDIFLSIPSLQLGEWLRAAERPGN